MRKLLIALACVSVLAPVGVLSSSRDAYARAADSAAASDEREASCHARARMIDAVAFRWYPAPPEDAATLERWCRAVGVPVIEARPAVAPAEPPRLDELVVITWNAHLAEGELADLVADLRAGALTDGEPVRHFVLLLQELYRRGRAVPAFAPDARSAFAIEADEPNGPDAEAQAEALGLAMVYVPSMRNGADLSEDRGNAIVSTEPLRELFALELPFERQRRVVAGAAIAVSTDHGVERLQLVDAHLEPLASASSLWLFRNPRRRQMAAILELLHERRFTDNGIGTVLAGDFNTIQGGAREAVYGQARAWSRGLGVEDPRPTHMMGRLDYVFVRLADGWRANTVRVQNTYGSDHHPVLARFQGQVTTSGIRSQPTRPGHDH